jgi:hypothetical protein
MDVEDSPDQMDLFPEISGYSGRWLDCPYQWPDVDRQLRAFIYARLANDPAAADDIHGVLRKVVMDLL